MIAAIGIICFAIGYLGPRLRSDEHLALVMWNTAFADWLDIALGLLRLAGIVCMVASLTIAAWRLLP